MTTLKFSMFSSSTIFDVEVRPKKKSSKSLLHGLHRAEIDISHMTKNGLASKFIADCLQVFGGTSHFIVFSGVEDVRLDGRFSLIASGSVASVYKFVESLSSTDIEAILLKLPYGAVSILNATDDIADELSQRDTMDMDSLLETLSAKLTSTIQYDESGVLTLLAKQQHLVKGSSLDSFLRPHP